MKIFGFEFGKSKVKADDPYIGEVNNEALPEIDESAGGFGGQAHMDSSSIDFIYQQQNDLIEKYRELSKSAYVESAIDDIVNESIIFNELNMTSPIIPNFDETGFSDATKKKLLKEWEHFSSNVYNFRERVESDFREWYIDGQKSYYLIKGEGKTGLKEMRAMDSLYVSQIVKRNRITQDKVQLEVKWIYDIQGKVKRLEAGRKNNQVDSIYYSTAELFNNTAENFMEKVELKQESVAHTNSGLRDENGYILSFLHRSIQPFNTITNFENSILIYTIVRAPQRRIFYVDTGLLQGKKAESYIKKLMNRHKNKMILDTATGDLKGTYNIRSMLEDYWLPRQDGSRGTDVQTLDGGGSLTEIEFVNNFKNNLWESLRTPASRRGEDPSALVLGRTSEISRDEIKFKKFTNRITQRFSRVFVDAFLTHLILKNVITEEEKKTEISNIFLLFGTDNHFTEIKNNEILQGRLELLETMSEHVGKYFSEMYIMKNVLQMTEDEIKEEKEQMELERKENEKRNAAMNDDNDDGFESNNNNQEKYDDE